MEALQRLAAQAADASYHFQKLMSSEHNYIPDMAWEKQLQDALALSKDQQRFMLALFASVLVGAGIRLLRNPTREPDCPCGLRERAVTGCAVHRTPVDAPRGLSAPARPQCVTSTPW